VDAVNKVKAMLKLDPEAQAKVPEHIKENIDKYGLGTKRSLQDYYNFAEIDVANRKVSKNFCAKSPTTDVGEGFANYNEEPDWTMYILIAVFVVFILNVLYWSNSVNLNRYIADFRRWFAVNRRFR